MIGRAGFFEVGDRRRELSAKGDNLERIAALVDVEMFRSPRSTARLPGQHPRRQQQPSGCWRCPVA